MEFFYKGIDTSGKPVKSAIEAANLDEAKKRLKAQGILFSDISLNASAMGAVLSLFKRKEIPTSLLSTLSRDIAVYLNAGIPLVRALSLMKYQHEHNSRLQRFYETLIASIHEGKSFAQALENQDFFTLPTFYIGTLKISEDRGILAEVLNELSSYLSVQEKINKQLRQAMIYPSFIIVVSILMLSFMLSVVVPKITSVFETTGQALPMLTQWIIDLSNLFAQYWFVMLAGITMLSGWFIYQMARNHTFKKRIHRFLLNFPVIGKMIETGDLARFCTISALLIRSGIPVVNTIKLSCITLSSEVIKEVFEEASGKIVEGASLSKALHQNTFYPIDSSFIEAVSIGEETSEVSSMLEHLAQLYMEANRERIGVFLALLEPTLMLLIGSIIGVIVTAMLLPIFSLNLG